MKTGAENMIDLMKDQNQYKAASVSETENETCTECEKLGHACSSVLFVDGKTFVKICITLKNLILIRVL